MEIIKVAKRSVISIFGVSINDPKEIVPNSIYGTCPLKRHSHSQFLVIRPAYFKGLITTTYGFSFADRINEIRLSFRGTKEECERFYSYAIGKMSNWKKKSYDGTTHFKSAYYSSSKNDVLVNMDSVTSQGEKNSAVVNLIIKPSIASCNYFTTWIQDGAVWKILSGIIILAFAYLLLCNNRYINVGGRVFDKWTRTTSNGYGRFK